MADITLSPSFYADFSGLTALKKDVKADDPQAIRAAARQFESLFTDMMLKSMRAAKLGDGLGDSQQTDFYQDMYDQQLSLQMSQGKGLGLADMLVQQLTRNGALKTAAGAGPAAANAPTTPAAASARATPAAASAPAASPAAPGAPAAAAGAQGAVSQAARISFIQRLEPYVQSAAAQLGVSSTSLIAQAALETGWGTHVPTGSGGSSHNLFGIKAGASWGQDAVSARTTEYGDGTASSVPQSFRAYSSLQQGVNDYVTLLRRSPGYQQALGTGDDTHAFASALQRGGYATDPDYARKLVATADAVRALRAGTTGTAGTTDLAGAAGTAGTTDAAGAALKLQAGLPTTSGGEPA